MEHQWHLITTPGAWSSWVFWLEAVVLLGIGIFLIPLKAWAFGQAMMFSSEAYTTSEKLTKLLWGLILGLGLAHSLFFYMAPQNIFSLLFTIAALVFFFDVRPALKSAN
jgi:hypothetical protein